ncbi:hypothetical protein [Protofrankia symbiont of Coriaria ruscifolia]|nr:hypothetical protein [Protofrankia symbiont of Coriaria ruscifolia]
MASSTANRQDVPRATGQAVRRAPSNTDGGSGVAAGGRRSDRRLREQLAG